MCNSTDNEQIKTHKNQLNLLYTHTDTHALTILTHILAAVTHLDLIAPTQDNAFNLIRRGSASPRISHKQLSALCVA